MIIADKEINCPVLILAFSISILCNSCLTGFQKKNEISNSQHDDCGLIEHLKSNFKSNYNHLRFSGTTKTTRISENKYKVIQDSIQIIVHDDNLDFYEHIENGLINGQSFISEKDFYRGYEYREKELPHIKHTFSIWGVKESSCFEEETEMKKLEFVVSVGDCATNGSMYYLEFKTISKYGKSEVEEIYLVSYGITI